MLTGMLYRWSFNLTKLPSGPSTACNGIYHFDTTFPEGGSGGTWEDCESSRFQSTVQRTRWCYSEVNPEPPPPSLVLEMVIRDWGAQDIVREIGEYEFPNGDLTTVNGGDVYIGPTSFHVKPQRLDIAC